MGVPPAKESAMRTVFSDRNLIGESTCKESAISVSFAHFLMQRHNLEELAKWTLLQPGVTQEDAPAATSHLLTLHRQEPRI